MEKSAGRAVPSKVLLDEEEQKPCDWNELKVQLNNVTIMHGPAGVTLAQAEEAMLRYIGYLAECDTSNASGEAARETP